MDAKLQSLMQRMCQLGQLMDRADIDAAIEADDTDKIAEIGMVLAEFKKTEAELHAFLEEQRQKRNAS